MELLIVCAIIGIMSAVALVYLGGSSRSGQEAELAAREVAASVREAQNNALAGKQPVDGVIACGHGFYFAANGDSDYKIFYNPKTGADCSTASKTHDAGSGDYIDYSLPSGVQFSAGSGAIYFDSPHANVYRNGSLLAAVLTITITKNSSNYNICVYPSGNVTESKTGC